MPKNYEFFCTSETAFKSEATLFYSCSGVDAQACEDAGGKFTDEDGGKCEEIDLDTDTPCNSIPGFTYKPDTSCDLFASYIQSPVYGSKYLDCSSKEPGVYLLQNLYQSTCCGGTSYHKNICPGQLKPYEYFCTSDTAFEYDKPLSYECKGTDAKACENAGGKFTDEDGGMCEDIDNETDTACKSIPGFTYEVETSCGEFASYMKVPQYADTYLDCTKQNPQQYQIHAYIQSTCCGGRSYHKNICPNQLKPYEYFCTSDTAFEYETPFLYKCKGTDAKACEDAGGKFTDEDGGKCEDIDNETDSACKSIPGFTYEAEASCGEFASYMSIPQYADKYLDCTIPEMLPFHKKYQSTCCGGRSYHKTICDNIASADLCGECNVPGSAISDKCFNLVKSWYLLDRFSPEVTSKCEEYESASDIDANCKAAVLDFVDCSESNRISSPFTPFPSLLLTAFLAIAAIRRN